ncbi:hypothetical protein BHE74_00039136 [Ensete ventricosum]|nr:hypothetical protein BHE74_00039136 [Ensete ventricosum]
MNSVHRYGPVLRLHIDNSDTKKEDPRTSDPAEVSRSRVTSLQIGILGATVALAGIGIMVYLKQSRIEHCWFRPVCASSPAVVSTQRWSSIGWEEPSGLAWEVGCWSGGVQVGGKCFSSGQLLIPARRSGRVGSRRDPSDGQVSSVVDFVIPLIHRGAGAFIVIVTGRSYLRLLSSLLLTILLHLTTPSVVLAMRRASSFLQLRDVDLAPITLVRSVVRRLTLPCLCQACSNTSTGLLSEGTGTWQPCQYLSYHFSPLEKTLSRLLTRVPKMRSCNELSGCSEVRVVFDLNEHELIRPSRGSGTKPAEQEWIRPSRSPGGWVLNSGVASSEQGLGFDRARAQELI